MRTHLVHLALAGHDVGHRERTHQPQLRNMHDGQIASREIQAQVINAAVWLDVAGQEGVDLVGVDRRVIREVVLVVTAVRANDSHFVAVVVAAGTRKTLVTESRCAPAGAACT